MISKDFKDTETIALSFLKKILSKKNTKDNTGAALVVCLSGDLGVGKTAFTKVVLKHLGVKEKVTSPTFVIMKKYKLKSKSHKFLFHLDAYRLKNEMELLNLGWEDIINNTEHMVFIEWPENVAKAIPKHAKFINILIDKKGHRNFNVYNIK